jgi:hypothetical protein
MLFWAKIFEDGKCPGLLLPDFYFYLELLLISTIKPIEKYLASEPRSFG